MNCQDSVAHLPKVYSWEIHRYKISLHICVDVYLYTVWRSLRVDRKTVYRSVASHMPTIQLAIEYLLSLRAVDAYRLGRGEIIGGSQGVTIAPLLFRSK